MSDQPVVVPDSLEGFEPVLGGAPATPRVLPPSEPIHFPLLWYTSGTPHRLGMTECTFKRAIGNHLGTHGTGWQRRATAIPLATGSGVHQGVELLGGWILDFQKTYPDRTLTLCPDQVIAWAAAEASSRYQKKARERGLLRTVDDASTAAAINDLILEQATLIEAQVWIYGLVRLPFMLQQYRLLAAEFEETPVLDCTCGLGDWVGTLQQHVDRNCAGIVAQGRTDLLWEKIDDGSVLYEELKTKAWEQKSYEDSFEHSGQLFLNMEAASRRLGKPVQHAHVTMLFKGKRGRDKGQAPTEPKWQHSPLCYGFFTMGVGGPEWVSDQWITDEITGKRHKIGSAYQRTAIWDPTHPMPSVREGASRVESWVRTFITPDQYPELLKVCGPYQRQARRVEKMTQSFLAEERDIREKVAVAREYGLWNPAQAEVADLFPRSWNCTNWDGTPCAFRPICDDEPGSEDINSMERFEIRTPHHAPERQAFEQAGVVFPGEGDEEDA